MFKKKIRRNITRRKSIYKFNLTNKINNIFNIIKKKSNLKINN